MTPRAHQHWGKLGLVLEVEGARPWAQSHAAVPLAHPGPDGGLALYFSSRDGASRSHTGRVELDLSSMTTSQIPEMPVLAPGPVGSFDEDGAMLSWLTEADDGTLFGYYIGWNRGVSVPLRNSLGLALSTDGGLTFEKYSAGPILDRSVHDPCFVASACVLRDGGAWRMWYLSCVAWERTAAGLRHRYHVKYAESDDGIRWRRDGRVAIDFGGPDEYAISRPCVVRDGGLYRMWYSHRGDAYRIGYAESPDGYEWTRRDDLVGLGVSDSGWDSEMVEYPFVFDAAGSRYMLYNGNGYGLTGTGVAVLEQEAGE